MAKILIGIALVIMLATAALGFLTKGKIETVKSTLKSTQGELKSTQGTLSKTKTELADTTDKLATANGKIDEQTKDIAAKATQIAETTQKLTDATAAVEAKTQEVAKLTMDMDELKKKMPTLNPGEDLSVKIAEMQAQVQKAQTELIEAKQVQETVNNRLKDTESKLSTAEAEVKRRQNLVMRQGLTGRILAVNAGWNFVVLSIGDKQGVVVSAPMLVMRDGVPIAKIRITSVEASTSIADVVPGSVRRGVTVQPGDNVVFEGRSPATQPAAPPAPAEALPAPPLP